MVSEPASGVFRYDYSLANVTNAKKYGITSLRLGFNVDTALDRTAGAAVLKKMRSYVDEMGAGILCMWDTLKTGQKGHGDGYVNNVTEAVMAWKTVANAFKGANVKYEIFNEPVQFLCHSSVLRVNCASFHSVWLQNRE